MLKNMKIIALSVAFSASSLASANNVINYTDMEKKSSVIYCKNKPDCVPFKEVLVANGFNSNTFIVDGITLPADALKDEVQQLELLEASLYVTENGEVLSLPKKDDITAESESDFIAYQKRQALLPVKIFPAPVISNSSNKVIIKVK